MVCLLEQLQNSWGQLVLTTRGTPALGSLSLGTQWLALISVPVAGVAGDTYDCPQCDKHGPQRSSSQMVTGA